MIVGVSLSHVSCECYSWVFWNNSLSFSYMLSLSISTSPGAIGGTGAEARARAEAGAEELRRSACWDCSTSLPFLTLLELGPRKISEIPNQMRPMLDVMMGSHLKLSPEACPTARQM